MSGYKVPSNHCLLSLREGKFGSCFFPAFFVSFHQFVYGDFLNFILMMMYLL